MVNSNHMEMIRAVSLMPVQGTVILMLIVCQVYFALKEITVKQFLVALGQL